MKMHESQPPSYWWTASLGFFSLLSLQDYVFILGAVISALFTIKTYYAKRREEKASLLESRKRTQLLAVYLNKIADMPADQRPPPKEVMATAMLISETIRRDAE